MKAKIRSLTVRKTGYGHWRITVEAENPALKLPKNDPYWKYYSRKDESEHVLFTHVSTNSRAIDGYDGFEVALAKEAIRASEWDVDMFDYSSLRSKP